MKRAIVAIAILFFAVGMILVFSIQETRVEEAVIDEWSPITPSTLYPQDVTGWAFNALTSNGTFLELNISASGNVTVIIGALHYNDVTGEGIWNNVIFNQTGTTFTQKVEIAEKNVDFLEIKNEGANRARIFNAVKAVIKELNKGARVAVVISAMGKTTHFLLEVVKEATNCEKRRVMLVMGEGFPP